MWYSLYLMILLLVGAPSANEEVAKSDINGYWHGEITQNEGGYRSSYTMELIISEKDGVVTGYSYVSVDDIYATMTIKGKLTNNLLFNAKDITIEDDEVKAGMEWCMKNYILILKKEKNVWKLEGHWNGRTSFSTCTPGKVFLKRIEERA